MSLRQVIGRVTIEHLDPIPLLLTSPDEPSPDLTRRLLLPDPHPVLTGLARSARSPEENV